MTDVTDWDVLQAILLRRDFLCRHQPRCPACNDKQVQIKRFDKPAVGDAAAVDIISSSSQRRSLQIGRAATRIAEKSTKKNSALSTN